MQEKRRGRPPKVAMSDRRKNRARLDGGRYKLRVPEIPGYVLRWVNDTGNRINDFTVDNDWEFVNRDEILNQVGDLNVTPGNQDVGSRVSRVVGSKDNGQALLAYLLKIKRDFYEEDQREKQEIPDRIDAELRRGTFTKVESQYGDVSIKRA